MAERGYALTLLGTPGKISIVLNENPYDALFIHLALVLCRPLKTFLAHVRDLLTPNGTLFICGELVSLNDPKGKIDDCHVKEVIAALYENGFVINTHEEASQPMENSPKSSSVRFHMIFGRKSDLFLRPYRKGDENTILPVFREVFKAQRSMAHWHWKFRDNPYGAYKIAQAVSENGDLAGHYSGYPVPFYASSGNGNSFLSFQIGDIMTLPGFRRLGLGKTSVLGRITEYFHYKFCVDHIPFLYGFVGGSHRKFGERFLGYQYMSEIPFHVLELKQAMSMPVVTWIKNKLYGVRVEEIHDIGSEFNDLFKRAAGNYGMLVKRDAQYMKWRYGDCPDNVHRIFALKRFEKLMGWCVFRLRDSALIWGDALFQEQGERPVRMVLSHVLHAFQGVQRIEAWFSKKPAWWTKVLRQLGFKAADEPNGLVAGVTIFDPSFSLGSVEAKLYYTMGDSDLF
ncbi:MAG: GNAT family N-acetyltransferase [Deltaproteobacteria bacterium]|nr:GNAT family N-acetyltransferase [Deltaproteobacteria bacterium]